LPRLANSALRWSITGASIARKMRSGTFVGPGIWRKWRPVWIMATPCDLEVEFYIPAATERNRDTAFQLTRWYFVLYEMREIAMEEALFLAEYSRTRRTSAQQNVFDVIGRGENRNGMQSRGGKK
jgi:hypothetical protein